MAAEVQRLSPDNAEAVVDCFRRVYGDSYANGLFYDSQTLADAMTNGRIYSVGAFRESTLVAHMAMTIPHPDALTAELGNTVVDPSARGGGLAWQVGDELTRWCRSLGYAGFLHYPTTDHHIMQRQSIKAGYETGLMLGYIPAQTDGGVRDQTSTLRQAATVVYQPLARSQPLNVYCPSPYQAQLTDYAKQIGLPRTWLGGTSAGAQLPTEASLTTFPRRGLARLHISRVGDDFEALLENFLARQRDLPCLQLDVCMDDTNIGEAAQCAARCGFLFCAWLPGFTHTDVLRLQKVDLAQTEFNPQVVNPTARALLLQIKAQLS